jgi:hypothetical protein
MTGHFQEQVAGLLRDLPGAILEFVGQAEQRAADIKSGAAQVSKPAPEPEPNPAPPPAVERRSVIVFQNSRWQENGATKFAQRFALVDLPVSVAERAISRNLGDDQSSPRGLSLRRGAGISHGTIHFAPDAVDLDAEPSGPKTDDAEIADAVVTIGTPRTLLVDAERRI